MKLRKFFSPLWLRRFIFSMGLLLILLAFAADWLGIGDAARFGRNQLFSLVIGLFAIAIGFLFRPEDMRDLKSFGVRLLALYKGAAILLLNTMVLIIMLEMGAFVIIRSLNKANSPDNPPVSRPVRAWEAAYWPELNASAGAQFYPSTIWRNRPYLGETIQVGENGIRQTPGADCVEDAYRVFTFGGSALWGLGSPDWGTIPAYLQAGLDEHLNQPVCVINFGQNAFVSSQELTEFILQLQQGNVPDFVIFYDGFNDISAALYEKFAPNPYIRQSEMDFKFEQPALSLVSHSNLYMLLNQLVASPQNKVESDKTIAQVIQTLQGNYKIVSTLADTYQFGYAFYLQPLIILGNKPFTPFEQFQMSKEQLTSISTYQSVYTTMEKEGAQFPHLYSLANVFDTTEAQIYLDFVHLFPEGNEIVAQEMLSILFEK